MIVPSGYQGDWTAKQVYQGYLADGMSAGTAEAYTEVLTGETPGPEVQELQKALQKARETGFAELAAQLEEYERQGIQRLTIEEVSEDEVDVEPVFESDLYAPLQKSVTLSDEEWRYTLGPVYMPGQVDAHGDSIDADELEKAIHDYVKSGDRRIRLQHDTDVVAGEWVGLLTWPWEVTIPVWEDGVQKSRTYPAGTPFMGTQWEPEVWEKLVKPGHIRGYSLGGFAEFMEVETDAEATKALGLSGTAGLSGGRDAEGAGGTGVPGAAGADAEADPGAVGGGEATSAEVAKYAPGQPRDRAGRFSNGVGGGVVASVNPATGYRYTAHDEAQKVYEKAAKAEPAVTERMQKLAAQHGATLSGLEYRLKEPKSLARKINADANEKGITDAAAAADISDSVRYTMVQKEATYAATAGAVLDDFHNAGYGVRSKNFWVEGDPYQGINVALTAPDGQKIELQFHTQESLDVKMNVIHAKYEEYRTSTDNARRKVLWDEMVGDAKRIDIPPKVLDLPQLKTQSFQTAEEAGVA